MIPQLLKTTYLPFPLNPPAARNECWVYDLDGTLALPNFTTNLDFTQTNISSQSLVFPIENYQPQGAAGVVLTYRPHTLCKETLEQLVPIKSLLHTLYLRNLNYYPHYEQASISEYKLRILEILFHTYKRLYFFEDNLAVLIEAKRTFKNLTCYHVQHPLHVTEV